MNKIIWSVYYSATGTTKKIINRVADKLAEELCAERKTYDFTSPLNRDKTISFNHIDIVVFGSPVYAGRIPNLMLKYISSIKGNGALVIPIVLFGNRAYDDGLIELCDLLELNSFHTIAAAAFVGQHSFSKKIANGRPDISDLEIADKFSFQVSEKIRALKSGVEIKPIRVPGVPIVYRGYFKPKNGNGSFIDIRKVKPLTLSSCEDCKLCVEVCPMGAIDLNDPTIINGICIKCCACIQVCPLSAKYFDDADFLFHVRDLELKLNKRARIELFL